MDLDLVFEKLKDKYKKNPQITIDGLKIDFDKEWVHLRKSNTDPIIRIYAESDSASTAEHLAKKLMMDIKELVFS
jgi:phosphomannomutase